MSADYGFENGVAIITGASSGIGLATLNEFARLNCTTIIAADLNAPDLAAINAAYPAIKTIFKRTDVSSETDVAALVAAAVADYGRIDYLVNCAGILGATGGTGELGVEDFDKTVGVNLRGAWMMESKVLGVMDAQEPRMNAAGRPTRGTIVNISSILGLFGQGPSSIYATSKHGLVGLTKSDALQYARRGIRVNAVCPGMVRTNIMSEDTWVKYEPHLDSTPMGRFADTAEVASAVCWLAGEKSGYVTGVALPVDGGYVAQ